MLCLLLAIATLGIYNPVTRHPFVNYDDDRYVTQNLHVRQGLTGETIFWAFTSTAEANWHPLTWISHALDVQLFHLNPAGHHYVNVLFHTANAILLFLLLWRATGSAGCSLMTAALFALHPLNVESVAWVAERKNVLSMLFFLLAVGAYDRYLRKPGAARYALAALCFGLGLMAKPMIITLPFVLLLWDYWPARRMGRGPNEKTLATLVVEKIPLVAMSVASAIVTMIAQSAGGAVRAAAEYSLLVRAENAIVAYARYAVLAFWPAQLAPMYPHPGDGIPAWQVLISALFLTAVTALVIVFRRIRYLPVGWFWFLGTLVPMIGLVQVGRQAMADRYAYLPLIGLFVMVSWGAADLVRHVKLETRWLAIPALAALVALSARTYRQLGFWSDNVILWTHTLAVTGKNAIAQDNLGGALIDLGKIDEAMPHFQKAAEIDPADPIANSNLATYALEQGRYQEAITKLEGILNTQKDPHLQAGAWSNLGVAYARLGDTARAKENYERAVKLDPQRPQAWIGLGVLAQKAGDLSGAVESFSRAVEAQPSGLGYALLAQALEKAGRTAEAQAAYAQAGRLSGSLDDAKRAADSLLAR